MRPLYCEGICGRVYKKYGQYIDNSKVVAATCIALCLIALGEKSKKKDKSFK